MASSPTVLGGLASHLTDLPRAAKLGGSRAWPVERLHHEGHEGHEGQQGENKAQKGAGVDASSPLVLCLVISSDQAPAGYSG